ncbi:MAG: PhoU domain-containing protein [Candidatus Omnitrophica bacterium]|nr:PhoU domain-containing protein [Candidatus Omnitrophota bacterium]
MFGSILSFWKGKAFLSQILEDFGTMLNSSLEMFRSCYERIADNKIEPGLQERIYKLDREINEHERHIRKRIIMHLSIQGNVDMPMCLIMMSVVKDAERIGDYAKNIFEVSQMLNKPLDKAIFNDLFGDIEPKLRKGFLETKKAFVESDKNMAKEILKVERDVVLHCDATIEKLAKSSYDTNLAVCLTLLARYFKRIAAHLANISSSVILPIQDLDFFNEKFRRNEIK